MGITRRDFLGIAAGSAAAAVSVPRTPLHATTLDHPAPGGGSPGSASPGAEGSGRFRLRDRVPGSFDPWIEVHPPHLRANAVEVARAAGGRPVLATIKNNGYGLGLVRVAEALEREPGITGFAVVKVEEAHELLDAGIRKPVLLMTRASEAEAEELVGRGVHLAPFWDGDGALLEGIAARLGREVPIHFYLDTGMSRLGMPYHRALPWMEGVANRSGVRVEGSFMGFTEVRDFDLEQLARFRRLAAEARERGIPTGKLHAASSNHVTFLPESHLDMVRPGLVLFGAQVAGGREAGVLSLTPAIRLRGRVLRVERLRIGDSVSYGRNYVAERPVWVAAIPVGHAEGYPRQAVNGCRILVGRQTYPVIGAVSASHCIIEVGEERTVEPGETATLLGPDHPDIHPNEVAERTGRSVYDILMHLSPAFPLRPWEGS